MVPHIQESLSIIYLTSTSQSTLESRIHHSHVPHPQVASHNLPLQTATLQESVTAGGTRLTTQAQ